MNFSTIIRFGITLVFFSGLQTASAQTDDKSRQEKKELTDRLTIDNGAIRSTEYEDSNGNSYKIRYLPVTIRNNGSLPVNIKINFSEEYTYPTSSENSFHIAPVESGWVVDGVPISDLFVVDGVPLALVSKLTQALKNSQLKKSLKPGDEFLFGIVMQHDADQDTMTSIPEGLFVRGDTDNLKSCNGLLLGDRTKSNFQFGLKVSFNQGDKDEYCAIIPCGKITQVKK